MRRHLCVLLAVGALAVAACDSPQPAGVSSENVLPDLPSRPGNTEGRSGLDVPTSPSLDTPTSPGQGG